MNDWRLSSATSDYKEALKATDNIEPPASGFLNPSKARQSSVIAFSSIIKQNNTIIQLLLTITERVRDLEEKVQQLQQKPSSVSSETFESSLSALQNQLESLSLVETANPTKITKPKGPLFVFKDPKKIFQTEKLKGT